MIIALEEAKYKLMGLRPDIEELGSALKISQLKANVTELEEKTSDPSFWSSQSNSSEILQTIKQLKDKIDNYEGLVSKLEDAITLAEMAIEENEESYVEEIEAELEAIVSDAEKQRIQVLLSGEYDANNAIINFHAGAGGTEACDWAQMLMRMYSRWAERRGYKVESPLVSNGDFLKKLEKQMVVIL